MVLAPGCYEAIGARLVEEAGFPALYMTGFGSSASRLGRPDVGLMTLPEMVDSARRIAQAVAIPLIADADTGYGNPVNVIRTVREYEAAGAAAIHIEDQVMPKKCGHVEGKQSIPVAEMAAKVSAAVAARSSPDFLIIARTDACAVDGLPAAWSGRGSIAKRALTSCSSRLRVIGMSEIRGLDRRFADVTNPEFHKGESR
jgi:2-methylisocitrate lyase-like PEP mutase family enzyme